MSKFESALRYVQDDATAKEALRVCNILAVLLAGYDVFYALFILFLKEIRLGFLLLAVLAVPFGVVTLFRRWFNAPRPCELFDFFPETKKKGHSFPSRHVFSIFLIGVLTFSVSSVMGILTLAAGVLLAVARVLLGLHFPRDVIAGGLIGLISGGVGLGILLLFR